MPINRWIELNGFEFVLTTLMGGTQVLLDIGNDTIAQAITERDPRLLDALEKLVRDYHEIHSVLGADESFSMWLQSSYAANKHLELYRILHSEYASDSLKQRVRQELGYVTPPTKAPTPAEWYAMMYGVYQAMSDEEKQDLHQWEQEYVDGSGDFVTSDWPGWAKYIGQFPQVSPASTKSKKRGYVYLVRAETGEYKIGYSMDVENRIKAFSVQPPFDYQLVHSIPVDDMIQAEAALHKRFSGKRIKGEWFALEDGDVEEIMQLSHFKNERFVTNEA